MKCLDFSLLSRCVRGLKTLGASASCGHHHHHGGKTYLAFLAAGGGFHTLWIIQAASAARVRFPAGSRSDNNKRATLVPEGEFRVTLQPERLYETLHHGGTSIRPEETTWLM